MRIIMGTLIKFAALTALPLLLSACLFSVEPLLDETNSVSGDESADIKAFVEASHLAYDGMPGDARMPMIPYFEKEASTGDLSVIRAVQLGGGMLLIQQELRECISDHCFVYYGARMVATWWPDICLVETEADEAQDALRALASGHGVKVTLISDNDKAPPDFGMDGPRDSQLEFLRAQFTVGQLSCSITADLSELHGASALGTPADITELIAAGADANASTSGQGVPGITPLHLAAYYGNPANIAALIEAGAEIGTRDTEGATPVHWAAKRGSPEAIVVLIAAGADVNARLSGGDYPGATPLHIAAAVDNAVTIAALVTAGADVNARLSGGDYPGATPLHIAALRGSPATIAALIEAGADVNTGEDDGATPLHLAARVAQRDLLHPEASGPYLENVAALIEAGADVNARDEDGSTPLHIAAQSSGPPRNIAALLNAGAKINARDNIGQTPLHDAAALGSPANVEALLDAGADGSLQDNRGKTPFELAEERLYPKLDGSAAYSRLEKARHE